MQHKITLCRIRFHTNGLSANRTINMGNLLSIPQYDAMTL